MIKRLAFSGMARLFLIVLWVLLLGILGFFHDLIFVEVLQLETWNTLFGSLLNQFVHCLVHIKLLLTFEMDKV